MLFLTCLLQCFLSHHNDFLDSLSVCFLILGALSPCGSLCPSGSESLPGLPVPPGKPPFLWLSVLWCPSPAGPASCTCCSLRPRPFLLCPWPPDATVPAPSGDKRSCRRVRSPSGLCTGEPREAFVPGPSPGPGPCAGPLGRRRRRSWPGIWDADRHWPSRIWPSAGLVIRVQGPSSPAWLESQCQEGFHCWWG